MAVTWTGTPEEWDAIVEFVDRGIEDWQYISGYDKDSYTEEDIANGNASVELVNNAIARAVTEG